MEKEKIVMLLLAVGLLCSCSSRKDFVYLQDMRMGESYPFDTKHEAVIHRDDRLSITVSCKQAELALPFNIQAGSIRVSETGDVTPSSSTTGSTQAQGYRVDVDGNIDFPILGKLHMEGLTVNKATELIKRRIIEGNYIKDPLVSIEFLNFKYTVLGAVGHNGTFTVNGDRITLLEAIANAGDVTPRARLDRVAVIREIGDERQIVLHDLRSRHLFNSPCFYLQQNDIVYVEPRYRTKDKEDRGWQIATILVSVASVICSALWVVK